MIAATSWSSIARQNQVTPLTIHSKDEHYCVEDYSAFYFDDHSILNPHQVYQLYKANKFSRLTTDQINFTHNEGTVWLALEIDNYTFSKLYLSFRSFYLQKITAYSFHDQAYQASTSAGAMLAIKTKAIQTSGYILEIPNSEITKRHLVLCAIKIDKSAPTIVRGQVGALSAILSDNRFHESITMAVLGILLVMLFYNACLYLVTQDNLYFFYCCYLIASVVVVSWINGLMFEWIWPNRPDYNEYPWPMGIYFFTQIILINKMLHVKNILAEAHKFSMLFILWSLIIVVLAFTNVYLSSGFIYSIGVLLPIYYVFLIIALIKRKESMIYIFILGWSPMLIVTVLNSVMTIGLIKYTELFSLHGVEICLAWEVVIFSLALGYRYNLIKQQIISVKDENLNIVENQKIILEQMVSERTEEILAQNEVLIRNQDQIQIQNEKLEAQNRAYEKLRELVLKQNQNLETAVNKRTVELANANQELKNNLRKIERFNFIAAHNLRGPVARILGLCMLVEKEEPKHDTIDYHILEKLKFSTRELDTIIHDLILILDIQSQNDKNYTKINLGEFIQNIIQQFKTDLKQENFKINLNLNVASIHVIPEYFDNILNNLISNSLKYRHPQHENYITITVNEIEDDIVISYKDAGIGFNSADFEDKIFEPFQKFHASSDGKGLGLFLIKSQISAMGGEVKLWSKPNMGIELIIQLPNTDKRQQKKVSVYIKEENKETT
jgi:signal transduction histidine kinase